MHKWLFSLLQGGAKELVFVKKVLARDRYRAFVKEVLGWILDTEAGTVTLPERKLQGLCDLLAIPTTQRRMDRKGLECLVGKLCSMHLAVPGVVAHLYHLHCVLAQAGADRAWMSPEFHRKIAYWRTMADQTSARPTHLVKIVRYDPTHLGFCDALGLGAGGV